MTYQSESAAAGRHIFPDLARAFALFGIALVNVGVFAYPMMSGYHAGGLRTGFDHAAWFLVCALFLFKSYSIFSFMFGVGFAYQIDAAERRGVGFPGRYARRILGLLFFGALNISLLFFGDILVIYAVLGTILFFFRKAGVKALVRWAVALYVVQIIFSIFFTGSFWLWGIYAPEEMAKEMATLAETDARAAAVFSAGGFMDAAAFRVEVWLENIAFMFMMQGFGAFSFFLFGLAAVRSGLIARPEAAFWSRARRVYLPVGVALGLVGAGLIVRAETFMDPMAMAGMTVTTLASPFASAGYLGLIAKWAAGREGPARTFFARGGTATLTAYLLQGLLFSLIFSAYGLGLYARPGAAACTVIAVAVALFSLAFSSLWRTRFARGPLEIVLRGWTYLGAR
ncbi:DUF418 domain-containing protein [Amphiplicatus metriothermophilus]|uniref:DUF418 domain-containing protein n=1 Tax=Amphiplicatus metriothermophilus TaxID=1519374 RepID=A0A239PTY4_9PROT|nr:DUF418 domain-containing protein [Amphiplicatus metriothermophilus]MBB5519303.1 uncharacterized protein [Amphiplicatus metriothermophilus]SNT73372.1 uncharacterized protein SAMN06297382_1771 [Amphiplicatus metriothermophilus]